VQKKAAIKKDKPKKNLANQIVFIQQEQAKTEPAREEQATKIKETPAQE
jgi:hypothetical protein